MVQKIIQVGNSYAMTMSKACIQELQLQVGQQLHVSIDPSLQSFTAKPTNVLEKRGDITPEFVNWLNKFNMKYKNVLTELAKK